ncbi:MAG TPA: hypothetical protein V6C57_03070 [Coleofasciculaceae cyanobacterium]
MNPQLNSLYHRAIQPSLNLHKKQTSLSSELENRSSNIKPLLRASDNGSRSTLQEQIFPKNISVLFAKRANSFTHIEPSLSVQKQLATGVKKSTIKVNYKGKVPQSVQTAFQYAASIWQTVISSRIPITIQVSWEKEKPLYLGSTAVLEAWRDFQHAPLKNTWYPIALANKFAGRDLDPNLPDAVINLNRNQPWYFGTDGNVPQGQFDLVTTAMHEINHATSIFGFMNYGSRTGKGSWGFNTGFPELYDRFIINGSGQRLLNTKHFPNPSKALGNQLTGNNLFFNGTHARNANGGKPPKLYAPSHWEPGSSYAHLDEATYPPGNPNSLITPGFNFAEAIHNPGPIAMGILKDMGWISKSIAP